MDAPPDPDRGRPPLTGALTAAICAVLLLSFAFLSFTAARTKCATFDEPLNTVGAWMILHEADWRVHPDHPALWQYWAALPNGPAALSPDRGSALWPQLLGNLRARYLWAGETLFKRPGVDGERVLQRSRFMMLIVALALGCLMTRWAFEIAGGAAAIAALALYSFDPNVLGHASLVKNDIPLAASLLLLAYATWRAGRRLTRGGAILF